MKLQAVVSTNANDITEVKFDVECAENYPHVVYESWAATPQSKATDLELRNSICVCSYNHLAISRALYNVVDHVSHSLGAIWIQVQDGTTSVRAAAAGFEEAKRFLNLVKEAMPPYASGPEVVPVIFWTATMHGGRSIIRDVDVANWEDIDQNYVEREDLSALMDPSFRPGVGGQLILWHGKPGTGKTTALRSLAHEWRNWCDLHYIVDPDMFFGDRADYMMDVMTEGIQDSSHWKLLVLEDCGELLQPDAKQEVGQALARLLNACDGLIGRGLRLLVLITTNEPLEKLHEAVARPGRCAALVEFKEFDRSAAREWLLDHNCDLSPAYESKSQTLADLYGHLHGYRSRQPERKLGFAAV